MSALLLKFPEPRLLIDQAGPLAFASSFSTYLQVPDEESACTIEAIHARAEAITPLLEEILQARPSTRWGINE